MKNLFGWILLVALLVLGCKSGDQTLGIDLLPGVKVLDTRYYQDTVKISASILTDTKIRVDRPKYNLLGSINDPLFGRTDAGFAAQFRLPYHPNYGDSAKIDSIVLQLYYKRIYGDTVTPQSFKVYRLVNNLIFEAKYLSSFNIDSLASPYPINNGSFVLPDSIGNGSFTPRFRTGSNAADTVQQVIRVHLDNSFGNSLLGIDSLKMTSNDEFLKVFKGLYIKPVPTTIGKIGTLVSIDPSSSGLILYYHDANKDTLGFAYLISKNAANVSGYVHDYSSARFNGYLAGNNPDSLIFVQPTGGIKTKITVPSLSIWKDSSSCIINRAFLTIHADLTMSDYRRYPMPDRLYLMVDTTGTEEFPADGKLSSSYYGGFYNSTAATYTFNITQHLKKLIDRKDSTVNVFYLVHPERNFSAKRVVLKGPHSSLPIELNVIYTRYK